MLALDTVKLVPLDREHLENSFAWANDPALKPLMLRVLPVCWASHERWYNGIVSDPSKMVFAILQGEDLRHVGNTGLYHIDFLHRRAEFWIMVGDPGRQGKGIGSVATTLMLNFAFVHLNLHRLFLYVDIGNARARTLYARQGFTEEGMLRQHVFIEGAYRDVVVMSLLRKEFLDRTRGMGGKCQTGTSSPVG